MYSVDTKSFLFTDSSHWATIHDYALNNYMITSTTVANGEECRQLCWSDTSCHSANFYIASSVCELNSQAWEEDTDPNMISTTNHTQHYHFCAVPGAYMFQHKDNLHFCGLKHATIPDRV